MGYERKNPISEKHQEVLDSIARQIKSLRQETGLSIERFCSKNQIPRISYTNLESAKNFHMTTLLKVIDAYPQIKSISSFFGSLS